MSDHSRATGRSNSSGGVETTSLGDPHQLQKLENQKPVDSILEASGHRSPDEIEDVCKDECARKLRRSRRNGQIPECGMFPVVQNAAGGMITREGSRDMAGDCLRKEKTGAGEAERMILSKTSFCRMEGSFTDLKDVDSSSFLQLDVSSSQWQQCTDFNNSRKTESHATSKRKYCWDEKLGRSQLQATWREFSDFQFGEECLLHLSKTNGFLEKKKLSQSVCLWNDCRSLESSYKPHGFCRIEGTEPSGSTGDKSNHPLCGIAYKEKLSSYNCVDPKNEICEHHNHSFLTISDKKSDERLTKGFIDFKETWLGEHFPQSIPFFTMNELRRCITIGSVGRLCNGQDDFEMGTACLEMDVRAKSLTGGMLSPMSDVKASATLENTRRSEKSCEDLTSIQNPRNSGTTSLQMKVSTTCNRETELLESQNVPPGIETADAMEPNGFITSRTDMMDMISDVCKPQKSFSGHQPENLVGTEGSSGWVKRLKVNSSSVATMGHKMEDIVTTQRVHKLLSRVMNYSRSNSYTLAKCLQERQQFQKTMLLLRNSQSPVESLNKFHPWIQRWCQKFMENSGPTPQDGVPVLCEPEKTKQFSEDLEGKLFPSLAAMAMMGKSINNFRPCIFRRRGSSVVWNTDRF